MQVRYRNGYQGRCYETVRGVHKWEVMSLNTYLTARLYYTGKNDNYEY